MFLIILFIVCCNEEYNFSFYMLCTVDRKKCVLNGERGQNGFFFLSRPEALNVVCARPVTEAVVIEFGYANDEVKAASFQWCPASTLSTPSLQGEGSAF